MELRNNKNKKKQFPSKNKLDKNLVEQFDSLLREIDDKENEENNICLLIMKIFYEKDFVPLTPNYLLKAISQMLSFAKYSDLQNEIITTLQKNKILFYKIKSKNKFQLNIKNCIEYLTSLAEKDKDSNTKFSVGEVIKTKIQYDSQLLEKEDDDYSPIRETNMSMVVDNNSSQFTFGDPNQNPIQMSETKVVKKFNLNGEDDQNEEIDNMKIKHLEDKATEKYIPNFDSLYDENGNIKQIQPKLSDFIKEYTEENPSQEDLNNLKDYYAQIQEILNSLQNKVNQFNNLSSSFNEVKTEIFNLKRLTDKQMTVLKIIVEEDEFLDESLFHDEREIYIEIRNDFKNLCVLLEDDYKHIKSLEQKINQIIKDTQEIFGHIKEKYLDNINDVQFTEFIEEINNLKCEEINANIKETLNLFDIYFKKMNSSLKEIENIAVEKKIYNAEE